MNEEKIHKIVNNCYKKNMSEEVKKLRNPIKSPFDNYLYRCIELPNGLRAIMISDCNYIVPKRIIHCKNAADQKKIDKSKEEDDELLERMKNFNAKQIKEPEKARLKRLSGSGGTFSCCSTKDDIIDMDVEENEDYDEADEITSNSSVNRNVCQQGQKGYAAISVCIGAGSFQDPDEHLGLAHLVEHACNLGSKAYPVKNAIHSFINNKGTTKAFDANTFPESTAYFYDVQQDHLEASMNILADMLMNPLLGTKNVLKEVQSVDSEWITKKSLEDVVRLHILKTVGDPQHPISRFVLGNKESLSNRNLIESVKEFHKKYYKSNYTTLVVQGPIELDKLQTIVVNTFAKMQKSDEPKPSIKHLGLPFRGEEFNCLFRVASQNDSHKLYLSWELPPESWTDHKGSPLRYISWLLKNEAENGLSHYLREKNLILDVTTCMEEHEAESFALITLILNISDYGLENCEMILAAVFSYIKFMKEYCVKEEIFFNIQDLHLLNLHFQGQLDRVENCKLLSILSQFCPPEDLITSQFLSTKYKENCIKTMITYMTPKRMNLMIFSKSFLDGAKCKMVEYYTKSKYSKEGFCPQMIKRLEDVGIYSTFAVPKRNRYLCENFSKLKPEDHQRDIKNFPINLKHKGQNAVDLWYRMDIDGLGFRKAIYNLYITNSHEEICPKRDVIMELWTLMLQNTLTPAICVSKQAGFIVNLSLGEKLGLIVSVDGFNEKVREILEVVLNGIQHFEENVTIEKFNLLKKSQLSSFLSLFSTGGDQANDLLMALKTYGMFSSYERYNYLSDLTFEQFKNYIKGYKRSLIAVTLIQGNESREKSIQIASDIKEKLKLKEFDNLKAILANTSSLNERILPEGESCLQIKNYNKEDQLATIINYYQAGPSSIKNYLICKMIELYMKDDIFTELRTNQQLAYQMGVICRDTFGAIGFLIFLKSANTDYSVIKMNQKIDEYLTHFYIKLEKLISKEKQENITKYLVEMVEEEAKTYFESGYETKLWSELLFSNGFLMNRDTLMKTEAMSIKGTDILNWVKNYLLPPSKKCSNGFRKLSIQAIGSNEAKDSILVSSSNKKGAKRNSKKKKNDDDSELKEPEILVPKGHEDKYIVDLELFKEDLEIFQMPKYQNSFFL